MLIKFPQITKYIICSYIAFECLNKDKAEIVLFFLKRICNKIFKYYQYCFCCSLFKFIVKISEAIKKMTAVVYVCMCV